MVTESEYISDNWILENLERSINLLKGLDETLEKKEESKLAENSAMV